MTIAVAAAALLLAAGPAEPTISGPFTHDNLQIFLFHGPDRVKGTWLTMQEAMAKKKLRVIETQEVSELAVENLGTDTVFIEAGEIVKGGQQDRVVAVDLVVAPKSGKVPIASFCVESGRWAARGAENVAEFSSSNDAVASKALKLAARKEGDQSQVWKEVAQTQEKLAANLGTDVRSGKSATSLQLTLENDKVRETRARYVSALAKAIEGKSDVIGFAFAINGQVNSVDVYASGALFRKLFSKKLEAAATEAVAELGAKDWKPATAADVKSVVAEARAAKLSGDARPVGAAKMKTRESTRAILFDTESADGSLHESVLVK
jgi:hypothetical protein